MYNPVEAFLILVGAAFAVGVCGAALAIGFSLGLRWFPMVIRINNFTYNIDPGLGVSVSTEIHKSVTAITANLNNFNGCVSHPAVVGSFRGF